MDHPSVIRPEAYAEWRTEKMGKTTLFESSRLLVGLNAFEPGQSHALHAHAGTDKLYHVLYGDGVSCWTGASSRCGPGTCWWRPRVSRTA